MKKVSAFFATIYTYLFVVAPVLAQDETHITTCPSGDPTFGPLCDFARFSAGRIISTIIVILLIAAVVIAVIFLIWGGIRWILSGGDKGKVDAARGTIIGAIIGLIISFSAFFIMNLIATVFLHKPIVDLVIPSF